MKETAKEKGSKTASDRNKRKKVDFTILCQDEEIAVSGAEARILQKRSDYFKDEFVQGLNGIDECRIVNPDWDSATASSLIELILNERTIVDNITSLRKVIDAANEVLLTNVRIGTSSTSSFTDTMNQEKFFYSVSSLPQVDDAVTFTFETPVYTAQKLRVGSRLWRKLAKKNIFLSSDDGKWSIHHKHEHEGCSINRDGLLDVYNSFLCSIDQSSFDFGGQTAFKITTTPSKRCIGKCVKSICSVIAKSTASCDDVEIPCEDFSLRLCMNGGALNKRLMNKICKATGAHGYADTKPSSGYYLRTNNGSSSVVLTFSGTFDQLFSVLQYAQMCNNFDANKCSLRLCNPSAKNLHHAIMATLACKDNPGTIGLSTKERSYFAIKTTSDMALMLDCLVSERNCLYHGHVNRVKLVELTHSKGVF